MTLDGTSMDHLHPFTIHVPMQLPQKSYFFKACRESTSLSLRDSAAGCRENRSIKWKGEVQCRRADEIAVRVSVRFKKTC